MDLVTKQNSEEIKINNKTLLENIKISKKLFIPWFHLLPQDSKDYFKVTNITKLIDININQQNSVLNDGNNQLVIKDNNIKNTNIKNTYNYLENIDKIKEGDVVSLFDKKNNNILILEIKSNVKYSNIDNIKIVSRIDKKCIHKKFDSSCLECLDNIITITNSFEIHNYLDEDVIIEKYYSIYKEIEIIEELDSLTIEILSKHYKNFPIGIKNSKIVIEI